MNLKQEYKKLDEIMSSSPVLKKLSKNGKKFIEVLTPHCRRAYWTKRSLMAACQRSVNDLMTRKTD